MRGVNHVAAWVAGIVHFILGACWYTAFSRPWLAAIGKSEADLSIQHGSSPVPYIVALLSALIIAYAIAWLVLKLEAQTTIGGAKTGAILALTLIATTLATNYGFEGRSLSLWLINTGYMLLGMAAMGAIIGAWGTKR